LGAVLHDRLGNSELNNSELNNSELNNSERMATMRRVEQKPALWLMVLTACGLAAAILLGLGTTRPASASLHAALHAATADDRHGGDEADGPGDHGDGEDDDEGEAEGILQTRPATLEGVWTLLIKDSTVVTVVATASTRFDQEELDSYVPGRWLEVKGARQADGSILAERIRVDDFEVGEVVVRLQDAAYSMTIASEYELTLTSTFLEDAHIYLYRTLDENEPDLAEKIAKDEDAGVIWAEVNYVNGVPEGDGYKTWGWGGAAEPGAYTGQTAYRQVGLSAAARAFDGAGVVVAVLDTGVYTPHEQFAGRLLLPSLDVVDDDTDASEVGPGLAWGHGTHVAGIIAAMAPKATLLPVRVLDANGRGNTFLLAYAVEWAVNHGADVINLSLGTEFDSQVLRDVVARAVAQGVVVVAAAGNGAGNGGVSTIQYPAGYAGVVGVTAVDANNKKATFANFGAGWVDVAAPGVGIMSTMVSSQGAGYATWSGTSMSTAFVSGAAAQVEGGPAAVAVGASLHDLLVATGTNIDAANSAQYAGKIGRLLNVSRALGVAQEGGATLYLPQMER
jgi:subtilisin family serine protease